MDPSQSGGDEGRDKARHTLKDRIPGLILKALHAYEELTDRETPLDAKDAVQHHAACKAALVHLEMLTKISRWTEASQEIPAAAEKPDVDSLVVEARSALEAMADED